MAPILNTIDISIVTYNSEKWLDKFFQSILTQSFDCKYIRLLIRDNGSTDETIKTLNLLQEKYSANFDEFIIENGFNVGFGKGHNANLQRAKSNFFLVTNVDLEFERETLSTLIKETNADNSEVAAWECRQKPYEHPKHYNPVTGEVQWCSSACVLFRTTAIKSVNGYEPRLFMYGEDVELSYRLRDNGYLLRYVPQATVWHYTYEEAAQVKPLQFLGSSLANVLIRCRYGDWHQVFIGFAIYFGLFLARSRFPNQRLRLLGNFGRLLYLAPQFLFTRRRSDKDFPFHMWDYVMAREGAFYKYPEPAQANPSFALPVVSVLVRTMPGRAGKLQEAIATIVRQTYLPIELVIVEDGGATAQSLVDTLKANGRVTNVVYLPLLKSGRCIAGNAALASASGDLMCFLDDDDLFYADHIEVLVAEWMQHPDLGAVYGLAYQIRTEIISHDPWEYRDIEYNLIYRQEFSRPLLWHHNYLPIQTVLFQRKLYIEYGGFDPELDNLEDWNLWVRYALHFDFKIVNKLTSLYRIPAKSNQATERQQVLDDYYCKAQAKHAALRIELSPPEVLAMAEILARELYVVGVPSNKFRRMVLRIPGIRKVYHPLRKAYHQWRRLRG